MSVQLPGICTANHVVVVLPEPPSANRYYRRHGHTMHRSKAAKAYCETVAALTARFRSNGEAAFPLEDIAITVLWHRGRRAGDLPNRTKVLYDALQGTLYADDAQIVHEDTTRCDAHPELPKGSVRVEVSAAL